MHDHAFQAQCRVAEKRLRPRLTPTGTPRSILLSLALGTFAIGTGEFGSNGVIQLIAADLDVSVPVRRTRSRRTPSASSSVPRS